MTSHPSLLALAAAIAANTAAVERLEAALLDAKAMKRPSRRAKCQWWIEDRPCPNYASSFGRCHVHMQRAKALAKIGVSPADPAYQSRMNDPIARTRPPKRQPPP
jgi:hypothetical protein